MTQTSSCRNPNPHLIHSHEQAIAEIIAARIADLVIRDDYEDCEELQRKKSDFPEHAGCIATADFKTGLGCLTRGC